MNIKFLHFDLSTPDDQESEYWFVTNPDDNLEKAVDELERLYGAVDTEDDQDRYLKAEFVADGLERLGYNITAVNDRDVIRRNYGWN